MVTTNCKCNDCGITLNSYDEYNGWNWDKMTLFRLFNKYTHFVKYHSDCVGWSYDHY